MRVKICGITTKEDAMAAVSLGASALGFVFVKESPRYVSPSKVKQIIEALPPFVTPVGIFVNTREGAVRDICSFTKIQTVQLHGDETPRECKRLSIYKVIKAFRVNDQFDLTTVVKYDVNAFLFDTYQENSFGGTGKVFNWNMLTDIKFPRPVMVSGGLTSENVREAIKASHAYAVDVSTSVEKEPGVKNYTAMRDFINAANKE